MNDTDKLIIGNGDFALIVGATEAPADETGYDVAGAAFGNIKSISPIVESEQKEHMGSYNGVKVRDDIFITGLKNGFKLTCDEFDAFALRMMFFAGAGVDDTDTDFTKYIPATGSNALKGYGRLQIYDGRDNAVPRIKYVHFSCLVRMSSPPTFDGDDYSSYEVEVQVLSDVGEVIVKKVPAPVV
jgi:hypothetical protein